MQYAHRHNPDGSVDSICPRCYITVATCTQEADLKRAEAAHLCEPWREEHYKHGSVMITRGTAKPPKSARDEASSGSNSRSRWFGGK